MDEASAWLIDIPAGSPVPTYNPSTRPISTMAALQRVTASMGGVSQTGTPPTPMPTLACTGMVASAVTALTKVMRSSQVPGRRAARVGVDHRSEDMRAGLLDRLELLMGPHAGQALAVVGKLAVKAEHALGRHAHLDGQVGVPGRPFDRLQRGQELAVAGRGGGVVVDGVGAHLRPSCRSSR